MKTDALKRLIKRKKMFKELHLDADLFSFGYTKVYTMRRPTAKTKGFKPLHRETFPKVPEHISSDINQLAITASFRSFLGFIEGGVKEESGVYKQVLERNVLHWFSGHI